MDLGDPRLPARFWAKVSVNEETGCWEWTAGKTAGGYAQFMWPTRGHTVYAHRLSYELLIGPIPEGLHIDHLCRNRACVNPAHLEPVTCRINLLRGVGPTAIHAAKTHCPQGHPLSGENLYLYRNRKGNVLRNCRACRREANARAQGRARAAA